ncbi:MAG: hypothetical protein K8R79_12440 [Calditrichales bacterium]|nr:hypothetical protein [Calditrichales bacterium]
MKNCLIRILLNLNILRLSDKRIVRWGKNKNIDLLIWAFNYGDFHCRKTVMQVSGNINDQQIIEILHKGLHDKVFAVAEESIKSIKNIGMSEKYRNEIEEVLKHWHEKHEKFRKNWNASFQNPTKLYIDRSEMIRLKQLKNLLAKPKSSMSIG